MRTAEHHRSEYESLRNEILGFTRQHFDMAVLVVTGSTLLFAYGVRTGSGGLFLCTYPLLFLALAHMWSAGGFTLRIASYIRVFHENDDDAGWESCVARLRAMFPPRVSGMPYQALYWTIAMAASFGASFHLASWQRYVFPWGMFACWGILNVLVAHGRGKRYRLGDRDIIETWRRMRDEEGVEHPAEPAR